MIDLLYRLFVYWLALGGIAVGAAFLFLIVNGIKNLFSK